MRLSLSEFHELTSTSPRSLQLHSQLFDPHTLPSNDFFKLGSTKTMADRFPSLEEFSDGKQS